MENHFLSNEQIEIITKKANELISIPILGEECEPIIFKFVIRRLSNSLYNQLPYEWGMFLNDTHQGFEGKDILYNLGGLKLRISEFVTLNTHIPLVNEMDIQVIFEFSINLIFDAFEKGKKLSDV